MLFLGIDQNARQLTVWIRDQNGDVILGRKVSKWSRPSETASRSTRLGWAVEVVRAESGVTGQEGGRRRSITGAETRCPSAMSRPAAQRLPIRRTVRTAPNVSDLAGRGSTSL